jgi:hypothetical protein
MKPDTKNNAKRPEKEENDLQTEAPIGERDEVKKAEQRTQDLQKKAKDEKPKSDK